MLSINLSFKEWPFLFFNQNQPLLEATMSTSEIEKLKSKITLNFISPYSVLDVRTSQQLYCSRSKDNIPDNYLPPINSTNKKHFYHFCSWGNCKLFACTYESCLSIFSYDDKGCLTPIFMFSPFERYSIGKIKKRPSKSSFITAIGWSNGYLQPCISKPILAVSSEKGHILIFDVSSKKIIGNLHFDDPIISILWSSYKQNIFYAGSSTGHIYICQIDDKTVQIVNSFDFCINSIVGSEKVFKSVDFITQSDSDGLTIAIASKDGVIGIITNINDPNDSNFHIFHNFDFNQTNKNSEFEICINYFEFYPNCHDFIMIATNSSTFLLSLSKLILIPFIPTSNSKFISHIECENDKIIVGYDNEVVVWKLADKMWIRLFALKIGQKFGFTEIQTFSKHDDKILMTTSSNWMTEIEYKRNKLFVTKRIKLIEGHPIDFCIGEGSIAFLTDNNSISFTSFTPESIIKQKFSVESHDSSDYSSPNYHASEESMTDDSSEVPAFTVNDEIDEFSDSSIENDEIMKKSEFSDFNLARSESDYLNRNPSFNFNSNDSLFGNSNSIAYTFNIKLNDQNSMIQKIEWISSQKVVGWCEKAIYLIDLQMRSITRPLKKKFDRKSVTITKLFFSKSRKIMCLILSHKRVYFINTESNFDIIKSINFNKLIKRDCDCLLGSFSPKEDEVVFASQNFLFFINLNENNESFKNIHSKFEYEASFISWEKQGILIGTERGNAFLIASSNLCHILNNSELKKRDLKVIYKFEYNSKFGSIKQILPCSNKSFMIVDSTNHGIFVSNKIQQIASNIQILKQNSKEIFLIYLQNYNKIITINSFNDFSPTQPPAYYSTRINNISFISELQIKNGNLLNSIEKNLSILNYSISYRNSTQLLNQILSFYKQFNSLSSEVFLKLGDLEKARNLLLITDPKDVDYLKNLMLAALYDSNSDSVQLVVKNLLSNNLVNLAVDILLMINDAYIAAEVLFKFGRIKEAYSILMLRENKSDEKFIAKKTADALISHKENVLCGLKLLFAYGYVQELMDQLSSVL